MSFTTRSYIRFLQTFGGLLNIIHPVVCHYLLRSIDVFLIFFRTGHRILYLCTSFLVIFLKFLLFNIILYFRIIKFAYRVVIFKNFYYCTIIKFILTLPIIKYFQLVSIKYVSLFQFIL